MKAECDSCFYREKYFDSATAEQQKKALEQELARLKVESRMKEQEFIIRYRGDVCVRPNY